MKKTKKTIIFINVLLVSIVIICRCDSGKSINSNGDGNNGNNDRVIAYSYPESGGNNEIYIMTETGTARRQLTNSPHRDLGPAWSPDGSKIAFYTHESNNEMNWLLYIMDSDGSNRQQLTYGADVRDHQVSWSPDGSQFSYAHEEQNRFEIWLMNHDGSNQHKIEGVSGGGPAWSPDGNFIAFHTMQANGYSDDILLMNIDGTNQIKLTDDNFVNYEPDWSPDGTQIAFRSDRAGDEGDIFIMDADGSNLSNHTNNPAWEGSPEWSPDGERIMFNSQRSGTFDIYIINVDGTGLTQVINTSNHAIQPDWLKIIN